MDSPFDADSAAKQRFLSFKMGGGAPPTRHSHRRSRSRNNSVSLPSSPPDSASLNPRPASHHHRRSSVSTRHESAELMGVSLPDLPTPHSDDNVNLGDKDSIRRRALWALEGRPDLAFSKVEIPDISSPDAAKPFDFPTKPSFPPGSGLNSSSGKRDSFGKMFTPSSASKDQLGTLVEEEEEEEEDAATKERKESPKKAMDLPAKIPPRHRPASLNLRPLSLVQGSIVSSASGGLPTPTLTPGTHSGVRKLFASASLDGLVSPNIIVPSQTPPTRRFSYTCTDYSSVPYNLDTKRRSSISYKRAPEFIPRDMISVPTPEGTPTEHRFSFASDQETLIEQPLSAADQHFLFKSHNVLLSRITELERTLKDRASHHILYTSDTSAATSEPSDEILQLVSDLKAERDELKRDVDGWRQRMADANEQASILAKRIEVERREAWVARSRLCIMEVEKSGLDKSLEVKDAALAQSMAENTLLIRERDEMKDEILKLNARLKDVEAATDDCARLRAALEQERLRRKEFEKILDDAGLLNTPTLPHTANGSWRRPVFPAKPVGTGPRGPGFQSIDSESSATDVDSADDSFTKAEFTLDAVVEESSEEDNGLAGYEDEDESDLGFVSPDCSSTDSADELDVKSKTCLPEIPDHLTSPALPNRPGHAPRASLSKTWTFPRGKSTALIKQDDEVDRFFGCLSDDADNSPPCPEERNQNTFTAVFCSASDDDSLPPFVLPSDVGVVVETTSSRNLNIVPEEEKIGVSRTENDEPVGEEVEGGIRFTFNAPPTICVTPPPDVCITPPPEIRITPPTETSMATPAVRPCVDDTTADKPVCESIEDDDDESSLTFVFPPQVPPRRNERTTSPPSSSPPSSSFGFRPSSRNDSTPSSIPRAISLRSMSPKTPPVVFTPSKTVSGRFTAPSAYSTPPSKKMTSSSIPQPVSPPKSNSTPTRVQTSFVSLKQSQSSNPSHSKSFMTNDSVCIPRCLSFTQSGSATTEVTSANNPDPSSPSSSSSAFENLHVRDTSSLPSTMSNPIAARSPFQKLSNFISFTWAPGAAAVASYIHVPSSSGSPNAEAVVTATLPSSGNGATCSAQRKFVPKARQLERLRGRLSLEKKNGITPCCMVSACKGCSAGDVYL